MNGSCKIIAQCLCTNDLRTDAIDWIHDVSAGVWCENDVRRAADSKHIEENKRGGVFLYHGFCLEPSGKLTFPVLLLEGLDDVKELLLISQLLQGMGIHGDQRQTYQSQRSSRFRYGCNFMQDVKCVQDLLTIFMIR